MQQSEALLLPTGNTASCLVLHCARPRKAVGTVVFPEESSEGKSLLKREGEKGKTDYKRCILKAGGI